MELSIPMVPGIMPSMESTREIIQFERKPTAIDCFAGCGGMSEGLKQAGFDVRGAIENDPNACDTYALNHPEVTLWRNDIQSVSAAAIMEKLNLKSGELDLLGGCPPCQGFSTLRTYNGGHYVRDTQNDLIFEFQRLILELLPKNVMMENVPGLYDDRRFTKFNSALENVGYHVTADILNVHDYGVPQRRHRFDHARKLFSPTVDLPPWTQTAPRFAKQLVHYLKLARAVIYCTTYRKTGPAK